jgi:hypothetical protein
VAAERTGWSLTPECDLRATTPSAALRWASPKFLDAAATPPHEEGNTPGPILSYTVVRRSAFYDRIFFIALCAL